MIDADGEGGVQGLVWRVDAATLDAFFVSDGAAETLGHPLEEWQRPHFLVDLIHPDDREQALWVFRAVAADAQYRRLDHRARTRAGDFKWMRTEVHPLALDEGKKGLLGIMVDITAERVAAVDATHGSQGIDRRIRMLLAHAPIVLFAVDPKGIFTFSSGRGLEAIGIDGPAQLGCSVEERYRDYPWIVNAVHEALQGEAVVRGGEVGGRWFETLLVPYTDEGGRVIEVVGFATNVTARKQAEAEVHRTAERLKDAQTIAHVGNWEWDIASDAVSWSDELYRIYGVPQTDAPLAFRHVLELVHPEDRSWVQQTLTAALAERTTFAFVHRLARPDGASAIVQWRGRVFCDEAERPVRMAGTCQDVTELRSTQHQLERSVTLLRTTLEATHDGILVVGRDGHAMLVNERFNELWSLGGEDDGRRGLDAALQRRMVDPAVLFDAGRTLLRRPSGESVLTVELKGGRVLQASSQQRPGHDRRVWSFRDITIEANAERERLRLLEQERLARAAAERAERRALFLAEVSRVLTSLDYEAALHTVARLIAEQLADACVVDLVSDGRERQRAVVACSVAALAPYAHRLERLAPALDLDGVLDEVVRAARPRLVAEIEHPGDEEEPALLAGGAAPVRLESYLAVPMVSRGRTLGILTLASVDARRRFGHSELALAESVASRAALAVDNAKLFQATREALENREEFLAVASHELRTPVTSLRLAVQSWLAGDAAPAASDDKTRNLFALLDRQSRQIVNLVNRLLDVARLSSQQLRIAVSRVDLAEVVDAVLERLHDEAERAGSRLEVASSGGVVGLWDRTLIDQVTTNLVSNAIKYGNHRPIHVAVGRDGETAWLVVRDEGIGIPAERLDDIFDCFSRAVSRHHYGGLGLGLYIVRRIVAALGGSIRVQSALGQGSTFEVDLPCGGPPPSVGASAERGVNP